MKATTFAFAIALAPSSDPTRSAPSQPSQPAGASPPLTGPANPNPIGHVVYPLVLVHGLDGFKNIGPIDYFYGVADALRKDGHDVEIAVMDAYNSSEVRGAQLLAFVKEVLARTGAPKVKLICHSQGGLDCRLVASTLGAQIAAVVTLSTPHHGTPIADVATGDLPGPAKAAVDALLDLLGAAIDGKPNMDAQAALQDLSTQGAAAFALRHPDSSEVAYYSIAGRSNLASGDEACGSSNEAPFVARWDAYLDPINPLLAISGQLLDSADSLGPNDGLVPVSSARWGTFLGCVPADHLDEMNQIAGAGPGPGNPFDAILFYRQLAQWMVGQGY